MSDTSFPFFPQGPQCRIAVVVLNYGTPELTLRAAETAAQAVDPARDLVLIVDNKSPDDSLVRLQEGLAKIGLDHLRLVESPVNGGFAAGNNVGIRAAQAEFYLLLNSDTIVRPGAIGQLLETAQLSTNIGLCSPRLEFEDGEAQTSCFRQHSPLSELISGAQTGPLTQALSDFDVPLGVQTETVSVPWTSFACVLIRRSVFETIGLLDEGFFMYYEDADFCRRARAAQFEIIHEPRARVVHLRGKSSPVKEATRLKKPRPDYFYEARSRFYRRGFGPFGAILSNVAWSAGRVVAWPREVVGQKERHVVQREFADNWKGALPAALTMGGLSETLRRSRVALKEGAKEGKLAGKPLDESPSSELNLRKTRLADFYIIGAMKCATSTLHEQLARRQSFFMTDPKEPNFFNDTSLQSESSWYAELFEGAEPSQITGESSTHYTKLPTYHGAAERIFAHTPQARLVYVIRDPLARMSSQFIHEWTEDEVACSFSEAVTEHERYLAYSSYARQLAPYLRLFDASQIMVVFFEHLVKNKEQELARIARFLGDNSPEPYVWEKDAAQTNVSRDRLKKSSLRDGILSVDWIRGVKDALPTSVKDRLKSGWQMSARPELDANTLGWVKSRLDADLAELGALLGLSLTTETFAQVAQSQPGIVLQSTVPKSGERASHQTEASLSQEQGGAQW